MKNKIIILTGDPNSINSEIIYKAWKKFKPHTRKKIYLIGNYDLIQKQFNVLGIKKKLFLVRNIEEKSSEDQLKIINIDSINISLYEFKKLFYPNGFDFQINPAEINNPNINATEKFKFLAKEYAKETKQPLIHSRAHQF